MNLTQSLSPAGASAMAPGARRAALVQTVIKHAFWIALAAIVLVLVVLPIIYVADSSLHKDLRFGIDPAYTLDTLISVYTSGEYLTAMKEALILSLLVTVAAVFTGVSLALLLGRTDVPAKTALSTLVVIPMFLSPFNGLLAWISLGSEKTGFVNIAIRNVASWLGMQAPPALNILSYSGAVWVMFLFFTPYVYLFTIASLKGMDSSLEEASRSCGATGTQTIFRVTLPMCLPAILGAAVLVFILAAETYTIPGVIGSSAGFEVLPWRIYTDAMDPPVRQAHAAAAATMLLLATLAAVAIQRWMTRKSERYVTVGGKGRRTTDMKLGKWKWAGLAFILAYGLLSTVLPLATLILSSLMKYTSTTFTADIFTLQHYKFFLTGSSTRAALGNTLLLAVVCSIVCMVVGTIISYGEVRTRGRIPRVLAWICILPIAIPGIVYGVGIQWVYLQTPLYGTVAVLALAYIAKYISYGVMMSRSSILQIHPELEQSARTCGAGPIRTLVLITGPLIMSGLISIVFLVTILCIKELSATLLLYTQRSEVLSVLTYSHLDAGDYQFAAAIGVVQTALIMCLVFAVRFFFNIRLEQSARKEA